MNYAQLTSIPLFTGISGDDLAIIMDRVDLLEIDLAPGEVFVRDGDVSQGMAILREGRMMRCRTHGEGSFTNARGQLCPLCYQVCETVSPGFILEPEVLFGLDQRHRNTWTAQTSCRLTLIGKNEIRQTLMYVPVWRINFVNLLCTSLQRSQDDVLPMPASDCREQVLRFLLRHFTSRGLSADMDITIEQMGHCLGLNRRTMTKVIGQLEHEGLVERTRQRLHIESIAKLRDNIQK